MYKNNITKLSGLTPEELKLKCHKAILIEQNTVIEEERQRLGRPASVHKGELSYATTRFIDDK